MALIVKVNPENPDEDVLWQSAELLRRGKVIGYPTETVYGLGANAFDRNAVEKLSRLKRRDPSKPVILLIEGEEMLQELAADVPAPAYRLMRSLWPGPLTIVFGASKKVPAHLHPTIALRVSSHPVASGLVRMLKLPLVSSSANISEAPPASSAQQVQESFPQGLELILDGGPADQVVTSTIVDVTAEKVAILREGRIGIEKLREVVGAHILQKGSRT